MEVVVRPQVSGGSSQVPSVGGANGSLRSRSSLCKDGSFALFFSAHGIDVESWAAVRERIPCAVLLGRRASTSPIQLHPHRKALRLPPTMPSVFSVAATVELQCSAGGSHLAGRLSVEQEANAPRNQFRAPVRGGTGRRQPEQPAQMPTQMSASTRCPWPTRCDFCRRIPHNWTACYPCKSSGW